MTTSATGKHGSVFIEVLVALLIVSVLAVPSVFLVRYARRTAVLDAAAGQVSSVVDLARDIAENERVAVSVIFTERSYGIFREDGELLDKEIKLPPGVRITEKTAGFDPVTFDENGRAKQAGHLTLQYGDGGDTREIVLYNLTGTCVIRRP